MATPNEQTAIRVALIGMVSAIIVALIANADKLLRHSPVPAPVAEAGRPTVVPPPATVTVPAPTAPAAASGPPPRVERDTDRRDPPSRPAAPPTIVIAPATAPSLAPTPAAPPPAAPALATGDKRLIDAWGHSNDGIERRQSIRNATTQPMTRLFVSSSTSKSEGPDRLGGVAVPPGAMIVIVADDGSGSCTFDMHAVFADGRELVQNSFNVCAGVGFFWQFGSHG